MCPEAPVESKIGAAHHQHHHRNTATWKRKHRPQAQKWHREAHTVSGGLREKKHRQKHCIGENKGPDTTYYKAGQ